MVADRLQFLVGFQELLFQPESKKSLRERSQLHRMLENGTWLFGEEPVLQAAIEGHGVALARSVVRDDLSAGRLMQLFPEVTYPRSLPTIWFIGRIAHCCREFRHSGTGQWVRQRRSNPPVRD